MSIAQSATLLLCFVISTAIVEARNLGFTSPSPELDESLVYLWPLPSEFTFGNTTLSIDPDLSLDVAGSGGDSDIVREAFERTKRTVFKHRSVRVSRFGSYGISKLKIVVYSDNETLDLGVDESYSLYVAKQDGLSIIGEAAIENVLHWHIIDEESFPLEVPSYPDLWKGSYTKWERYTVEDAIDIVK
ncbi:hypothetical protein Scep_015746 [Stephania cephalantha]|uniref:beta-N-acetylhexosaminidase n=1 Tax=Stephania cephalantha TaxID=152367 RepID=A0AAP0J563_9MAGN